MEIIPNYPLAAHNTFAVEAKARWWISFDQVEDLEKLSRDEYFRSLPYLTIGAGSNLLFLQDYSGALLHSAITGCTLIAQEGDTVWVRVGSAVVWDDFVVWALAQGYYGAENLSLIPGVVGAAAVQNIGAYGSEIASLIDRVETFDLQRGEVRVFTQSECDYGYRQSCFKRSDYAHYLVTHVVLRLTTRQEVNLSYKALQEYVGSTSVTPQDVREAVIAIRESKLPDPQTLPNAGSYFMNPVVEEAHFLSLQKQYPNMPHYPAPQGVKLSAAWLIDQAGCKGYRKGNVGTYPKQPLIIVAYEKATGREIAQFAREIAHNVKEKFDVTLVPEVRYIGTWEA